MDMVTAMVTVMVKVTHTAIEMADKEWTYIITPKRKWFDLDLKEYWKYRDLYRMYIRRDMIAAYKQTILGPIWYILQPLFTMVIYIFIFGDIAKIPTDGVPQPLFYFSGIILWNFFLSSFSYSSDVLLSNQQLFSKIYFPRLITTLSSITTNFIKLAIQLFLFIVMYVGFILAHYPISPNWTLALFPLLVILLAGFSLGWGLVVSSITYKYRDLKQVINFCIQLFMYVTPVVYPLGVIPEKFKLIIELNPLTAIFEIFRYSFTGYGDFSIWNLVYSCLFMIISLIFGLLCFNRSQWNYIDNV